MKLVRSTAGSRAGMTLVEVCVAVAVTAFATVALLAVMGNALQGRRQATEQSAVGLIQQRILCDLRSQRFGSIQLSDDGTINLNLSNSISNAGPVYYSQDGQPGSSNAYFAAYVSSQPVSNLPDLAAIRLDVIWPLTSSRTQTNTFRTWVARYQ